MESRIETHPGGKKSADGSVSASSADARKKVVVGVDTPDMSVHSLHIILIFTFSGCYVSHFWIIGEALLSKGLCFKTVQGHHLQLRSSPPLFHNFF